jgi:hypothetical protein
MSCPDLVAPQRLGAGGEGAALDLAVGPAPPGPGFFASVPAVGSWRLLRSAADRRVAGLVGMPAGAAARPDAPRTERRRLHRVGSSSDRHRTAWMRAMVMAV